MVGADDDKASLTIPRVKVYLNSLNTAVIENGNTWAQEINNVGLHVYETGLFYFYETNIFEVKIAKLQFPGSYYQVTTLF